VITAPHGAVVIFGIMEELVAAIDRGAWERALELALAAWAASPQAILIELVAALGERVTRTRASPITGERRLERKQSWLAAARRHDPRELDLLLATLAEAHNEQEWVMRFRVITRVLDPRIERFLDAYEASRKVVSWQIRPELERYRRLVATPPPDDPAYAPLVASVRAPEEAGRGPALLAAIYAEPDSDEARMIYADELQSRGDPRGELIALQLSNAAGTTERARELLGLHRDRWLGPLAPHVGDVTFARGFPAVCTIRNETGAAIPDDPAWSTIVEARGVPPIASMRALRKLIVRLDPDVAHLGDGDVAVRTLVLEVGDLELRDGAWWPAVRVTAIPAFSALRLPALRELELAGGYTWGMQDRAPHPADLAWALDDRTLDRLQLTSGAERLAVWWEELQRTPALGAVKLVPYVGHGAIVEISRDRIAVTAANRMGWGDARDDVRRVARGLAALPDNALASLVVSLPRQANLVATPHLAELEAAVGRQARATIDLTYRK